MNEIIKSPFFALGWSDGSEISQQFLLCVVCIGAAQSLIISSLYHFRRRNGL